MNNQEAIEVIKLAQAQIEWDYPMDYTVAFDMAISALQEQEAKHSIESSLTQNALDLISRQAAIDAIGEKPLAWTEGEYELGLQNQWQSDVDALNGLPSAQTEQLTDKEQRIFLAAMGREEKVCKEVDEECSREPYEDSLVRICHEITRKVKGALWNGK